MMIVSIPPNQPQNHPNDPKRPQIVTLPPIIVSTPPNPPQNRPEPPNIAQDRHSTADYRQHPAGSAPKSPRTAQKRPRSSLYRRLSSAPRRIRPKIIPNDPKRTQFVTLLPMMIVSNPPDRPQNHPERPKMAPDRHSTADYRQHPAGSTPKSPQTAPIRPRLSPNRRAAPQAPPAYLHQISGTTGMPCAASN